MDKDIWIMKHKGWSIAITLLIIFLVFVFFFLRNSEQMDLTGKVISGSSQNASGQIEQETSYQQEDNQTNDYEQIEEEQNQEEKTCEVGYLEEYKCDGNNIQQKYQYSNCSFIWLHNYHCEFGCEDAKCKPCFDSDAGKDYYVKGYIDFGYNGKYYDKCYEWDKDLLAEQYCNSAEHPATETIRCPYGCSDGKCNLEPEEQQNQEEKCDWGYSSERRCDGKIIEKEWINSDCSSQWFYYLKCYYGCENGECIDKPIQEPEEQSDYFTVTYIVDGDTLDVDTGERVRLICIDTPERGEYYYSEAKEYLKSLTLNKEVDLVKDISETDRYGRLLRYIYLTDGTFVNELMVRNGYARAYPYNPDTTLCPQIQEAESRAKSNNLGIWAEQEDEPKPTGIICSYNAYNCADFSTHAQAQAVFEYCGGISNDIHRLDGDYDGLACESLP